MADVGERLTRVAVAPATSPIERSAIRLLCHREHLFYEREDVLQFNDDIVPFCTHMGHIAYEAQRHDCAVEEEN